MSPDSVWSALLWLMISWVLALPIAWHRERSMIGLRTLPLVSIASCGFLLVGLEVAADDPNANARLVSGLMTGIGFIGGG
ncbi:MAG TPA: MgtC/SapB family protein, partial [Longimicrobiales bacterium]|nr:MgtC/SapB family protein [Longimicrobiales bacterium]